MQLATAEPAARRSPRHPVLEPLTVSHPKAQRLLDVGKTKYWSLVRDGKIETVKVGRRSMARYASLKRLAGIAE